MSLPEPKACAICGRAMQWRRKWADVWPEVKYCSARCRGRRLDDTDRALEDKLRELTRARGRHETICPSEAARAVSEDWRPLMERTREAARRLVARGEAEILQKGRVVDPSRARGPIRIRSAHELE